MKTFLSISTIIIAILILIGVWTNNEFLTKTAITLNWIGVGILKTKLQRT